MTTPNPSAGSKATARPWFVHPEHPLCIESASGNVALMNLARASREDAELIVQCVNSHAQLVEALRETTKQLKELIKDEADDPAVGIVGWNGLHQLCADNERLLAPTASGHDKREEV